MTREQIIEIMARAGSVPLVRQSRTCFTSTEYCDDTFCKCKERSEFFAKLALTALEASGLVVVPAEAVPKMINAGADARYYRAIRAAQEG